jgi:hypothetical protein
MKLQDKALEPANIPFSRLVPSILLFAAIACVEYILLLVLMQQLGLVQIVELRMINYVLLSLTTIYEVKRLMKQNGGYFRFLKVLMITMLTGSVSFALFSLYLFAYSYFDKAFFEMLQKHSPGAIRSIPALIVLFEGIGVSVIVGFINMQYFLRYETPEGHKSE